MTTTTKNELKVNRCWAIIKRTAEQDLYTHCTVILNALLYGVVAKPGIATGSRSKNEGWLLDKETRGSRVQLTMVTNRVRIDPFGPTFHIIFVPLLSYDSLVILFFVFMIFRIIWFNINSALFQLTQCYKCLKYMSSRRYFYIFLQNKSLIDFVCWGILIPYIHNTIIRRIDYFFSNPK